MAIIRCEDHPPKGRSRSYSLAVEPFGHPDSALVCGIKNCEASGLIWLEEHETDPYVNGQRIFEAFVGSAMKMGAK